MENAIICFEKINGERIIGEVKESGKQFFILKNPVAIYNSPDGTKVQFGTCLYATGENMICKLYTHSVSIEHIPHDDIINAYITYVKKLTSSLIQLDTKIQKVQLNG